ncbi:MAG: DivIVA domain-containing protein [Clostridia bacterium]|nr:DivIVA domain-containing protein [Clostridia bacterium]
MMKEEIVQKKFSRAFRGYDVAEVDFFLDALYDELTLHEQEEAALHVRIEKLTAALTKLVKDLPASEAAKLLSPEKKDAAAIAQPPAAQAPEAAPEKKQSRWAQRRQARKEAAQKAKEEKADEAQAPAADVPDAPDAP